MSKITVEVSVSEVDMSVSDMELILSAKGVIMITVWMNISAVRKVCQPKGCMC